MLVWIDDKKGKVLIEKGSAREPSLYELNSATYEAQDYMVKLEGSAHIKATVEVAAMNETEAVEVALRVADYDIIDVTNAVATSVELTDADTSEDG